MKENKQNRFNVSAGNNYCIKHLAVHILHSDFPGVFFLPAQAEFVAQLDRLRAAFDEERGELQSRITLFEEEVEELSRAHDHDTQRRTDHDRAATERQRLQMQQLREERDRAEEERKRAQGEKQKLQEQQKKV